jgi:hypothetical protein
MCNKHGVSSEIIVVMQFYRGTDVQFCCKVQKLLNTEGGKLKILERFLETVRIGNIGFNAALRAYRLRKLL